MLELVSFGRRGILKSNCRFCIERHQEGGENRDEPSNGDIHGVTLEMFLFRPWGRLGHVETNDQFQM